MSQVSKDLALAARVLELCNEAAFLAARVPDEFVSSMATCAAMAAGDLLGLTDLQVVRMQAEQSVERARIVRSATQNLRRSKRRVKTNADDKRSADERSGSDLAWLFAGRRIAPGSGAPANDFQPPAPIHAQPIIPEVKFGED